MDLGTAAPFLLASLAIELTPGPNMVWLAGIDVTEGRRAGLFALAGVALGLTVLGVAAGIGAALAATSPIYQALHWAGVAYLLWLAWQGWHKAALASHETLAKAQLFGRGLLTNLLNPKALMFYVTVMPAFLPPAAASQDRLILVAIYVAAASAVHGALVAAAGSATVFLADPSRALRIRRAMALVLVAMAIWLALR